MAARVPENLRRVDTELTYKHPTFGAGASKSSCLVGPDCRQADTGRVLPELTHDHRAVRPGHCQGMPLVKPADHAESLRLASEAASLADSLPSGVIKCRLKAPGMVELTLQAGDEKGYGLRAWPFLVGGEGLGDDPAFAAMLGSPPRAPVGARFAVPIAMHGVDDAGFVDSTFWVPLAAKPLVEEEEEEEEEGPHCQGPPGGQAVLQVTLRGIAVQAVHWLEGSHLLSTDDADARKAWLEAQAHTAGKIQTIQNYASTYSKQPKLFSGAIDPDWIAPAFRPLVEAGPVGGCDGSVPSEAAAAVAASPAVEELAPGSGIFAFDLFTPSFCDMLVAEVDAFEVTPLPRRRPNTMNNFGLIVNEIGLQPLMTSLLELVIDPLCQALYPPSELVAQAGLDHHHSFVVAYQHSPGGDTGLDMHHDASEATLNVCLGRQFEGCGLQFCGRFGSSDHRKSRLVAKHRKGRAVLHLGRQRHGADDITSGERLNLIVWARSSAFRSAAAFGHVDVDGYPRAAEGGVPDRVCLSKANDADFEAQLKRVEATAAADVAGLPPATSGPSQIALKRKASE